eukprot:2623610-Karenia_brevis.AAC.1
MKHALTTPRESPWVVNLVLLKWIKGRFSFGGGKLTHFSGGHLELIWGSSGVIGGPLTVNWSSSGVMWTSSR